MFRAGSDSGHNNGGHSGTLLIPTRFVWPYGGRRVFLTGSFTGWNEHILMSPMEGCPSVFQAICNLTPGCHQYKFNVDGGWHHDERQPIVTGSYGVVNTVDVSPYERSNMDVDPESTANSMLTDGILHEVVTPASEADIAVSRQRISLFLSQHTAYELLPESGKIIALEVSLPVKQAFHILYEQGIPAAPLYDHDRGHFVGVLSAIDFILILRELGNHGSNLTEEELETHTILAWKDGKSRMSGQIDDNGRPYTRKLVHVSPYDSLKDLALKVLQNRVSTVPILHSSDGSFPHLLHLASLSGILKCICRHFKHSISSLPILELPICAFPLGTWVPRIGESSRPPFAMLKSNASLGEALTLLVQAEVSSLPIVDDNHALVDIYSRSDITSLAKDRAYAQLSIDEMTIHQALQLGQDASSSNGIFNGQRCQMCLRSDPLHKVMERLANPGVRRMVVVEAGSRRVEGIITLSDVFRFLLG